MTINSICEKIEGQVVYVVFLFVFFKEKTAIRVFACFVGPGICLKKRKKKTKQTKNPPFPIFFWGGGPPPPPPPSLGMCWGMLGSCWRGRFYKPLVLLLSLLPLVASAQKA